MLYDLLEPLQVIRETLYIMTLDQVQNQPAATTPQPEYGLRRGAEEFPLQLVISIIYPCNFGCPFCPYTDGNSPIRKFYRENHADLFPVDLWKKIADEA